jgi:sugar fermentation stimulation protein A
LSDGRPLEVKGCTLLDKNNVALFPDSPTERGSRHLKEIIQHNGALLFLVFHPPARYLAPNCETDPKFCQLFRKALASKIDLHAAKFRTTLSDDQLVVEYTGQIPAKPLP